MGIVQQVFHTYASFFDWAMWLEVLTDPVSWGYIGTLVVLEGLLSADNALILAVMVRPLPKEQQKKALTYGMFGAYFFRFIFIGLGMMLIKFWWLKLLGGAYLAWIVIKHFWIGEKEGEDDGAKKDSWLKKVFGLFWATVISVELMDIAFSVDSIMAAFAVSDKIWILLFGGMIGILMMRTVAKGFLVLIEKVPELENTAFILIAIIAVKMLLSTIGLEIGHIVFFTIIVLTLLGAFTIHYFNRNQDGQDNPV